MVFPNLKGNGDSELLKTKIKDDEIKELKYRTEKHDHNNILKLLKNDDNFYEKGYRGLNKMKILLIIFKISIGSGSAKTFLLSILKPSVGIIATSSTALITSIAISIRNE